MSQVALTVGELARRLDAVLEGDATLPIIRVAGLSDAGPQDATWVGAERYLRDVPNSRAGVILLKPGVALTAPRTVLRVGDPEVAICRVQTWLAPAVPIVSEGVHASAVIESGAVVEGASIGPGVFVGAGARVGNGTQLHAGAYVGASSQIGENCVLWPNVVVRERVVIGDRVVIHANATIGADGFGYLARDGRHIKIPQTGTVVIEDDVEIGAGACIDRARLGETRIGRGSKIDNLVQVAHNVRLGEHCILVAQCGVSGSCTLGDHVVLAGQVGVAEHIRIGDRAQVGAQAGILSDLPGGSGYLGSPASEMGEALRQMAAVRRLPKLLEQFRVLLRRVEKLESSADHRA